MEENREYLKKAMKEIDKIIEKYNINAIVLLADGKENGEFKYYHDTPKWSMLTFDKGENGQINVHMKLHMKSNKKNTKKTVNSLYVLQGMIENSFIVNKQLCNFIKDHVEVTITDQKIIQND